MLPGRGLQRRFARGRAGEGARETAQLASRRLATLSNNANSALNVSLVQTRSERSSRSAACRQAFGCCLPHPKNRVRQAATPQATPAQPTQAGAAHPPGTNRAPTTLLQNASPTMRDPARVPKTPDAEPCTNPTNAPTRPQRQPATTMTAPTAHPTCEPQLKLTERPEPDAHNICKPRLTARACCPQHA